MAGYLITLDSEQSLNNCVTSGIYSTILIPPRNNIWDKSQEGTFADYSSMKAGDNIFFFINRKIYGIGELVNVGDDCKYLNYPNSSHPNIFSYAEVQNNLLFDYGESSINQRFICFFRPNPYFFRIGVDMDDALFSNPHMFKMIRVFQRLSFIKFDDEENQALLNILLQRNKNHINNENLNNIFNSNHGLVHQQAIEKLNQYNYQLDCRPFLNTINNGNSIRHEKAIEASLIFQLSNKDPNTIAVFGSWDYLNHQVPASPFKPVDWMDKIDVFGFSYIPNHKPTREKFLVIELKKDTADKENFLQLMRYVDWVKNEYSNGDYSMIEAFLVASEFTDECIENRLANAERNYVYGVRPVTSNTWSNVTLVKYSYNQNLQKIDFEIQQ